MNKHVTRGLLCAAVAGGLWAAGTAVASADVGDEGSGIGSDLTSVVDLQLPVTIAGNAVGGDDASTSGADTTVAAASTSTAEAAPADSGTGGILSGGSSAAIVSVPVTVSGNAVSVLGDAHSEGAATTVAAPADASASSGSGSDGLLSGDSSGAVVSAPVTVSGNAVSVLGDAHSEGAATTVAAPADASASSGSGSDGLLSGDSSG
ncbi:hypothetical protein K6Y82_43375, partial [Burkholderia cenocepacia]